MEYPRPPGQPIDAAALVERLARAIEYHGDVIALALRPGLESPAVCLHPEAAREDTGSTMGRLRWRCTACGYVHEQVFGAEART